MALSLGAEGISQLPAGHWETSINYRYLYADEGWIGDKVWPQYKTAVGNQILVHSLDLQAAYAFSSRWSATLTIPLLYAENNGLAGDGTRQKVSAAGLGDVRLVGNVWLLDPAKHADGNISLGMGVKAPTGDEGANDSSGQPVDVALQLGDGGWGIELELLGYQKIIDRLYGYVAGSYLINPREKNGTLTEFPVYGEARYLSVPDQYLGRLGLQYVIWPEQGLSLSFGGRIDGIPTRDLIGGSDGFRRPGFSLYVEPGVSWTQGKNTLSVFTPVLIDANRQKNIYDDRYYGHGAGAFADFLVIASFSHWF